jgi:hypothetical protein
MGSVAAFLIQTGPRDLVAEVLMGVTRIRISSIEAAKCWDLGSLCWLEDTERIRTDEYDRFDVSVDQVQI